MVPGDFYGAQAPSDVGRQQLRVLKLVLKGSGDSTQLSLLLAVPEQDA